MDNQFAKLFDVTREGHVFQVLITQSYDADLDEPYVMLKTVVDGTVVENRRYFKEQEQCDLSFARIDQGFADAFIHEGLVADFIDQIMAELAEVQS